MRAHAILGLRPADHHLRSLQSTGLEVTSSRQLPAHTVDLLVVLGGDGTIHRFLSDLILSRLPVLVLPYGSGNDLARSLGIRSIGIALQLATEFARGNARIGDIDIGIITDACGTETPFCCTGGVGLDVIAAGFASRLPAWIRARGGYLLGAARALLENPVLPLKLTAQTGEGGASVRMEGESCLCSFANTPSFGGGLRIAPHAQIEDGQLDCVWVDAMSRARLAAAMISLLRGTHLQLKEVHSMRATALQIETHTRAQVYADGEFVCETPIKVRVLRRAFPVLRLA